MNFTVQNLKRLLSGFFAGGVFFCAWTQDLVMDSVSTVPQNTLNADSADYDKVTTERLLTFSKNFSLRMLQNGKATPADIERMLQLLALRIVVLSVRITLLFGTQTKSVV
jgi:hypothetical protein